MASGGSPGQKEPGGYGPEEDHLEQVLLLHLEQSPEAGVAKLAVPPWQDIGESTDLVAE